MPKEDPRAEAAQALRRHAEGYTEWIEDWENQHEGPSPDEILDAAVPPGRSVHHRGVLVPPVEPVAPQLRNLVPHLRTLRDAAVGSEGSVIFAFDSLDRLPSAARFNEAVRDDVRVLKAAGIGVVVVGTIRFAFGKRSLDARFVRRSPFPARLRCRDA